MRVGLASHTPEQLSANIETVMTSLAGQLVGWKNVRAVHVKGPNTMALPIWLAEELWVDEEMVLEDGKAAELKAKAAQKGKRKRKLIEGRENGDVDGEGGKRKADGETGTEDEPKQKKVEKLRDDDLGREMKERREKLRQQQREARGSEGKEVALSRSSEEKPKVKKSKDAMAGITES